MRLYILLIISLFLIACTPTQEMPYEDENKSLADDLGISERPVTRANLGDFEIKTLGDGTRYIVHPSKIKSGGPPMDGIPSIDNPTFVTVEDADWIKDDELVMAIIYKEVKRVYPLQIMVWHEIVNDVIAGDPVLITWCPLCGSAIAYERVINDEAVEFGTSGKLYNSNLVMYDRKTETYWTQIDGVAIYGDLSGNELKEVPIETVVWRDWKSAHPDSEVLSKNTGEIRPYGIDPYGSYYEDSYTLFPLENEDNRIHAKTVVFGVEIDGKFKAYKESDLKRGNITDEVNERNIVVEKDDAGVVMIKDLESGLEYAKERTFWFAWYAFHPDTLLYEVK